MSEATADAAMPILALREFGVAFGERVVLSSIDLQVPDRGVMVLLGPSGTGKSTLLRTLAGFNSANPSLRVWGSAEYQGEAWGTKEHPSLVAQSARLLMSSVLENILSHLPERSLLTKPDQRDLARRLLARAGLEDLAGRLDEPVEQLPLWQQRQIAILRMAAGSPRLLCVDEPTVGLSEDEAAAVLRFLRAEGEHRAVMVVLHNQVEARLLGGTAVLIAGGRVIEVQPAETFFARPLSDAGRDFVRSGSCAVPAPDAVAEDLDEGAEPPPPLPHEAREYVSDAFGPRGFLWLKKGQLAGTPRPGVVRDIEHDLRALRRVGVDVLVTLTETPLEGPALADFGIATRWFPVPDMHAPSVAQAIALCEALDALIEDGRTVAVHCLAGLGRTGTVLAAYLIWEGREPLEALDAVRRIEPRWVQSERQVAFLQEFAAGLQSGTAQRSSVQQARMVSIQQ